MNPKLIAANALVLILILTLAPAPMEIYLLLSLCSLNYVRHFYSKGGRWGDDYQRTTWQCKNWQKRGQRELMASNCLWYRCSLIFTGLFLIAAVVL